MLFQCAAFVRGIGSRGFLRAEFVGICQAVRPRAGQSLRFR